MKAISLWQPWATLCVLTGGKQFETRHWYTSYRGPLLIHAAKKHDAEIREVIWKLAPFLRDAGSLAFGALIGRVDMSGCHLIRGDFPCPSEKERALGNWVKGRFAWEFANPERFTAPISLKGSQGFFEVAPEALIVPASTPALREFRAKK
jgi:hypothetical protein